jgi:hypothetical protein
MHHQGMTEFCIHCVKSHHGVDPCKKVGAAYDTTRHDKGSPTSRSLSLRTESSAARALAASPFTGICAAMPAQRCGKRDRLVRLNPCISFTR